MKSNVLHNIFEFTTFFGIVLTTIVLAWIFRKIFKKFIRDSTHIMHNDPTNYKFIGHAISALIYIVGFSLALYEMDKFRPIAKSLMAGAGVAAVAIGFASQQALGNIISGLFIVMFKPFRVNDRLKMKDNLISGIVEDITLRHTVIRDFENRRIIVPNQVMNTEILLNSDLEDLKIHKFIEFNMPIDADIEFVKAFIIENIREHPLFIDNRTESQILQGDEIVPVRLIEIGDYFVKIRAYCWARNSDDAFHLKCDINEKIVREILQNKKWRTYPHSQVEVKMQGKQGLE